MKKDLSIEENLKMAMERFPMLKELVKKYIFSLPEIERCRKECHDFVFSEGNEIWQLKEFFRHWLLWIRVYKVGERGSFEELEIFKKIINIISELNLQFYKKNSI